MMVLDEKNTSSGNFKCLYRIFMPIHEEDIIIFLRLCEHFDVRGSRKPLGVILKGPWVLVDCKM